MFGGATGDATKYTITDEMYLFHSDQNKWVQLKSNYSLISLCEVNSMKNLPVARAAHASCKID